MRRRSQKIPTLVENINLNYMSFCGTTILWIGNMLKLLLYIFSKYSLYISLGKIQYCSLPIYSKVSCNAWTKRKTTMFFVIFLYISTISIRSLRGKNCGTFKDVNFLASKIDLFFEMGKLGASEDHKTEIID